MKTVLLLLMLITTQANAKFVILANYQLDDIEIDCFSQQPQVFLFTKDAGSMSLRLNSLKTCYQYSSVSKKEFFECDDEKGLNRFVINEPKGLIEHSFKVNSIKNCQKLKQQYVTEFFLSRGLSQ